MFNARRPCIVAFFGPAPSSDRLSLWIIAVQTDGAATVSVDLLMKSQIIFQTQCYWSVFGRFRRQAPCRWVVKDNLMAVIVKLGMQCEEAIPI